MTITSTTPQPNPLIQVWNFLSGKKTYILAAAGVLNAIASSPDWQTAATAALPYLTGAAIRHGIATSK